MMSMPECPKQYCPEPMHMSYGGGGGGYEMQSAGGGGYDRR